MYTVLQWFINYALHALTQCWYASKYCECHTLFENAASAGAARTSTCQLTCSALHFSPFYLTLCYTYLDSSKFIIVVHKLRAVKEWESETQNTTQSQVHIVDPTFFFAANNALQTCASLIKSGCFFSSFSVSF